jgi:Ras-related protein Rab-2A
MTLRAKIVILGDPNIGKTSLVLKYVKERFPTEYKPTLGADFLQKSITSEQIPELKNEVFELIIWDIAGQTSYELDRMTDYYLQGSHAYILVYDVTSKKSLKGIEGWNKKMVHITGNIPFIVVGNKKDLTDQIEVTELDLKPYIKRWKTDFLFSSAKTGENVNDIFITLINRLLPKTQLNIN